MHHGASPMELRPRGSHIALRRAAPSSFHATFTKNEKTELAFVCAGLQGCRIPEHLN